MLSSDKKEVIAIRKTVPAGATVIVSERVKGPGTVEELRVRFYPGQSRSLRVNPYVLHKGDQAEPMLTYPEGTENFLSGDDDTLIFPSVVTVENDDNIRVIAQNMSSGFDYTLVIDVVIDYHSGQNRAGG